MGTGSSKTKLTSIFVGHKPQSIFDAILTYLQQPIIYFCCGLPLLAPSVFLIIVSSLGHDVSQGFLIVGSILFVMCVACFATCVALSIRNVRRWSKFRKNAALLEDSEQPIACHSPTNAAAGSLFSMSIHSNSATSTAPSSRRSSSNASLSSVGSQTNSVKVLSTIDKSKLINLKKKRTRRKRGVKFPVDRLPSLIEEDTFVKSMSRGNSQAVFPQENVPGHDTESLDKLKDYLTALGLGGNPTPRPPSSLKRGIDRRAKSFDEKDFRKTLDTERAEHQQPNTERHQRRRGSLVGDHSKMPVLVVTSHEKTGVRIPNLR